jgi:flavin-dependent dehydrogenase
LLAKQGYNVELFERDHFPRFHIGESLIPYTYHVIEKLGLLDQMKRSHFVEKRSAQFVNEHGKLSEPFFFGDFDPHERSQTWQVLRSEFDEMLLNNARQHGARVYEGTRVLDVIFDGQRAVGVRVANEEGGVREVRARVVVDASGQSSMLIDRLGLRTWDPVLRKSAVWTYWQGAMRDEGRNAGATLILQTAGKHGWFWYIPLHDDVVSVGVVASSDYLFRNRKSRKPEDIYFEEVARCPGLQPRIENATRCAEFFVQKEFSYKASQAAGDGWVLIGDAFGFLDPLYSSGVLLALTSADLAASAIGEALAANDPSETRLRRWEPEYRQGMERVRRLVCAYYDGLNFGKLVRKHPEVKGLITDVLIGNIFKPEIDQLWPLVDALQAEDGEEMPADENCAAVC